MPLIPGATWRNRRGPSGNTMNPRDRRAGAPCRERSVPSPRPTGVEQRSRSTPPDSRSGPGRLPSRLRARESRDAATSRRTTSRTPRPQVRVRCPSDPSSPLPPGRIVWPHESDVVGVTTRDRGRSVIILELICGRRPGEAEVAVRVRTDGRDVSVDGPEV
jgi:hypothetical protein